MNSPILVVGSVLTVAILVAITISGGGKKEDLVGPAPLGDPSSSVVLNGHKSLQTLSGEEGDTEGNRTRVETIGSRPASAALPKEEHGLGELYPDAWLSNVAANELANHLGISTQDAVKGILEEWPELLEIEVVELQPWDVVELNLLESIVGRVHGNSGNRESFFQNHVLGDSIEGYVASSTGLAKGSDLYWEAVSASDSLLMGARPKYFDYAASFERAVESKIATQGFDRYPYLVLDDYRISTAETGKKPFFKMAGSCGGGWVYCIDIDAGDSPELEQNQEQFLEFSATAKTEVDKLLATYK